jgi:uridylate kinase
MDSDPQPRYSRILLKLSGEVLAGSAAFGIDPNSIDSVCRQIKGIYDLGLEIAIVIGGGNIFRGLSASEIGMDRVRADGMGMLATVINSLALQDHLENLGVITRVMSAVRIDSFVEPYIRRRAVRHLEKRRVIMLAGGTGNPYFSTDTAAALRASEVNAEVVLKATKVDGVYSDDPLESPDAEFYPRLDYMDVVQKDLKFMDLTAITLCRESGIPIIVFDMYEPDNLKKAVMGEQVGTIISGRDNL